MDYKRNMRDNINDFYLDIFNDIDWHHCYSGITN